MCVVWKNWQNIKNTLPAVKSEAKGCQEGLDSTTVGCFRCLLGEKSEIAACTEAKLE